MDLLSETAGCNADVEETLDCEDQLLGYSDDGYPTATSKAQIDVEDSILTLFAPYKMPLNLQALARYAVQC